MNAKVVFVSKSAVCLTVAGERRVEVLTHQLSEARQSYTLVTEETEQLRRVIGELQQELRSATQERDASLQEASEKFRGTTSCLFICSTSSQDSFFEAVKKVLSRIVATQKHRW